MLLDPDLLSDRERDCLLLFARGRAAKEIATDLGIAPNTVKVHLRNGSTKLGITPPRRAARALHDALMLDHTPNQKGITTPQALVEPEVATPKSPPKPMESGPNFTIPFLRFGRRFVTIGPNARIICIPLIAGLLIVAGAVIANLYGALEMIRQLQR